MPKLVLFAACEKAIVDQTTNVVSLMGLLQDVNLQLPPETVVPSNLMIPMQWTVVSIWQRVLEDKGKTFEQRSQFIDNSGQLKLETPIAAFELKEEFHRVFSQVGAMSVGTAGAHQVKCMLRERGAPDWKETAAYPINIKWLSTPSPTVH
jgi:hypothetical protein